jgi:hypothetical protein
VDARSYPDAVGRAYLNRAGTDWRVGIVSPASSSTAGHELGHVYGAKHNDFRNFGWFSHTVMENSKQSCNGNDPQILEEFKYSNCAKSTIRDSDVFNF